MRQTRAIALYLLLGLPAISPATEEKAAPIAVEADQLELNQRTGISVYQGHVRMQQGSMLLQAERLELHNSGQRLDEAYADGKPAHLEQQDPQTGELFRAEANRIEYRFSDGQLVLKGEAHLWRGGDEFSGNHLIYDKANKSVRAFGDKENNGNGRVRVILQPEKEKQQ
jgi:lipopolysaccharide export system protein LptA